MSEKYAEVIRLPVPELMRYTREDVSGYDLRWLFSISDAIMNEIDADYENVGDTIINGLTMAFKKGKWMARNENI
jgi:hypothetical protein